MTMAPARRILLWLAVTILLWAAGAAAQGPAPAEYAVKAAFIYNFSKFVDWPAPTGDRVLLCVLGVDPFEGALQTVEGRPVGSRRFTSRAIERLSEIESNHCDILFIARSEEERLSSVLQAVRGRPVLTVGDSPGLTRLGVMIGFYLDQERIHFEINPRAATQAGLKPSAKLLQLGRTVDTPD